MARRLSIVSLYFMATLAVATGAFAGPSSVTDMSIGFGGAMGTISTTTAAGSERKFNVGGAPLFAMINRDLTEHVTGGLQVQMLLDIVNQQMLRQGFATMLAYHLWGGSRRVESSGGVLSTISTSPYNLSLVMRAGLFNYAASNQDDASQRLSGSIWEFASGFEYRYTTSEENAFGVAVMVSAFAVPASVERLKVQMTEFLLFWRFNL